MTADIEMMDAYPPSVQRGFFVSLEGGEGSGKSSSSKIIASLLEEVGFRVKETSEPRGSSIGEVLRSVILEDRKAPLAPRTESLLLLAERSQHVEEVIMPALQGGQVVLCDRFVDSTIAYQGHARGLPVDMLEEISMWASSGIRPDLTILFDLDPKVGLSRRYAAGSLNRLDKEEFDFHYSVREGFLKIAQSERNRFVVLDATRDPDELAQIASQEIITRIRQRMPFRPE